MDFVGSWAQGLRDLLESLDRQSIPRSTDKIIINPNWEAYRKRLATKIEESPEVLTTNWLRIATIPETIRYYQPTGAVDHSIMKTACDGWRYPAQLYLRGFFSFAAPEEIECNFANVGRFSVRERELAVFLEKGIDSPDIRSKDAKNIVSYMSVRVGKAFATKKVFMGIPSLAKWDFTLQRISFPLDERFNGASRGKGDPRCCKMSPGIGFGDMAFRHRPSSGPMRTSRSNPECYSRNLVPAQS